MKKEERLQQQCDVCGRLLDKNISNFRKYSRKTNGLNFHTTCRDCEDRIKLNTEWKDGKLLCHICGEYKEPSEFTYAGANKYTLRQNKECRCNSCKLEQRKAAIATYDNDVKLEKVLQARWLAAKSRAEGLSLDGVANNRCITKQQFNDNLPSGGGIADAIDLLNGSLSGSTLIFFNNTTTDTTMGISIIDMYGQSTSATPDIPASSMVVYPIAGVIRNVALFGNSVIGSNIYVAFLLNNVKNMNYYSGYETDRLIIGTNQNLPVRGVLAVMCINNT